MNSKHIWIMLFLSFSLLAEVHAMDVSVVIQFPSYTKIYLVNVSSNATAKDALIATGLNTTWSSNGTFLDCISGICGDSALQTWWCFSLWNKSLENWNLSSVGLASYNCSEGDAIGLKFLKGYDCLSDDFYSSHVSYCAPNVSSMLTDYTNDVVYWCSGGYYKPIDAPNADLIEAYATTNGTDLIFFLTIRNSSIQGNSTGYRVYLNTDKNSSTGCTWQSGADIALQALYNKTSDSWSYSLLNWSSTTPCCPDYTWNGTFIFHKSISGKVNSTANQILLSCPFSDLNINQNASSFSLAWKLGSLGESGANKNMTAFVKVHYDRDGDECLIGWLDAIDSAPAKEDIDGDGIPDFNDACPLQKETVNGYQDNDGCPDTPPSSGGGEGERTPQVIKEEEKLQNLAKVDSKKVVDIIYQFDYQTKSFYVAGSELVGVLASIDSFAIPQDYAKDIDFVTWKKVEKLEGDVYEISAKKVLEKFRRAEKVIIARGDLSVDSLAAIAYARALGIPILLTSPKEMPTATEEALKKLETKQIIVVGGNKAVTEEIVRHIKHERIAGEDRYETAVRLAEELGKIKKFDKVVITDGENPNRISAMIAAKYHAPIIYVRGNEIPEVTEEYITNNKDKNYILVGVVDEICERINSFIS